LPQKTSFPRLTTGPLVPLIRRSCANLKFSPCAWTQTSWP
jgi:hypothetical protein